MILLPSTTRKDAGSGLWLGFLIPILLFQSGCHVLASELISSVAILSIFWFGFFPVAYASLGIYFSILPVYFTDTSLSWRFIFIFGFSLCGTRSILNFYPNSFTIGEAILLVHLLIVFMRSSALFLGLFLLALLIERYGVQVSMVISTVILGLFPFVLSEPPFVVNFKLQQLFSCLRITHLELLILWASLSLCCVCLVYVSTRLTLTLPWAANRRKCISSHACISNSLSTECAKPGMTVSVSSSKALNIPFSSRKQTPFWLRKVFHFAAGLVFASGLIHAPQLLSFCAAVMLMLFCLFDFTRRRGLPQYANYCSTLVDPFRDKRDSGSVVFTPIALLLGLSIPIWWPLGHTSSDTFDLSAIFCSQSIAPPFAWSGVLSIAVGDSMAALVGRAWGKRHWPGSHRTFIGSAASWWSQALLWLLLARWYSWPWKLGMLPITAGVLVEAYTEQIDNLVVPLVVMASFSMRP